MVLQRSIGWMVAVTLVVTVGVANATEPYGTDGAVAPFFVLPGLGVGLQAPGTVPGKEYSNDEDIFSPPALDPGQVLAWDGFGGVADGVDLRTDTLQVDAIANHDDLLFYETISDASHLVFSVDDVITAYPMGSTTPTPTLLPTGVPLMLSNGHAIGSADAVSYELGLIGGANPPSTQGIWAPGTAAPGLTAVNDMPPPPASSPGGPGNDVDGLEVWGPEPGTFADTEKYSGEGDAGTGVSVYNFDGSTYITHGTIAAAVAAILTPGGTGGVPDAQIDLDALMVKDRNGDPDIFEASPDETPGDMIIFSIRQIADPSDPDGYYATGSELFVLEAGPPAGGPSFFISFLTHGGHVWDHGYTLTSMVLVGSPYGGTEPGSETDDYGIVDINAIEAVAEFSDIPEPATAGLLGLAAVALIGRRRRA